MAYDDEEFAEYQRILSADPPARLALPTAEQLDTLRRMIEVGRPLICHRENFWSFKVIPPDKWHVKLKTVWEMENRGWLRRKNIFVEDWKDTRELTERGRALPLELWQAKARGESLLDFLLRQAGLGK